MSASDRIAGFVAALPLRPGMRVLEIGCGPGVAARLILAREPTTFVCAIDRSQKAIGLARSGSKDALASGRLELRCVAVEDFVLPAEEARFDLAFAMRVGSLDGRHPADRALARIAAALAPEGRLFIDNGETLKEVAVPRGRPSVSLASTPSNPVKIKFPSIKFGARTCPRSSLS